MRPGSAGVIARGALGALIAIVAPACGRLGFGPGDAGDGDGPVVPDDVNGDVPVAQRCAESPYLICDGFEEPLDTTLWTARGDVILDPTMAHRGGSALRMRMPARNAGQEGIAWIEQGRTLAAGPATFWVRAWFRISALPAATNAMQLISLQQSLPPIQGEYVFLRSYDTQLYHQFDGKAASAGSPPPLDTWFCLVWQVVLATSSTGSTALSSDVVPAISVDSSITQSSPVVDVLGIGPFFAATNLDVAQPSFDVWVDDVIVDAAAVTCAD